MHNERQIQEEIELVNTLKMLTQAYEEISVLRMQRVKNSVLLTRDFLARLASVFYDVKVGYRKEIMDRFGRDKSGRMSFSTIAKNGKTVSVLLTANARLYGDIVRRVFDLFIQDIARHPSDIVIVGKLGKEFYDQSGVTLPYVYYSVPDASITSQDLSGLTAQLVEYENVNVYYGQFLNVVTQKPAIANITGEQRIDTSLETQEKHIENKFYFEPSLEKILYFFETQVFASLMKQTTHEGELSRLASRIRAMEQAITNIEERSSGLNAEFLRARKRTAAKKQLDSLTGVYLWGQ